MESLTVPAATLTAPSDTLAWTGQHTQETPSAEGVKELEMDFEEDEIFVVRPMREYPVKLDMSNIEHPKVKFVDFYWTPGEMNT